MNIQQPDLVAAGSALRSSGTAAETPKRVLVTTATWQSAVACMQSLGRLGHEVWLLDQTGHAAATHSRYCRGALPSPPESDRDSYAAALRDTLQCEGFDLLVPISDDAVDTVAALQEELPSGLAVEIAPPGCLELGRDKARVTRFAAEKGIPVPASWYPADLAEARALAHEIAYPCVCKLPISTGNLGVEVVRDAAGLIRFFEERGEEGNWPFVQEFVGGDLFDVTAVCDHGKVVAMFSFLSPIRYHLGGTPPYAYTCGDPHLLDTARRLLEALGWHGAVDLDFLQAADGSYRFLELNPRLSGTTNFAYKLGIDLPRAYHDLAFDCVQPSYGTTPRDGILFRTLVPAELWWWNLGRASRSAELLGKFVRPRVRTNLYWDDLPLLRAQLRDAARILARKPI